MADSHGLLVQERPSIVVTLLLLAQSRAKNSAMAELFKCCAHAAPDVREGFSRRTTRAGQFSQAIASDSEKIFVLENPQSLCNLPPAAVPVNRASSGLSVMAPWLVHYRFRVPRVYLNNFVRFRNSCP